MTIEFTCQVCGRELKADERSVGRKVRCPDCSTLLVIPDPGDSDDDAGQASIPPHQPEAPARDKADQPEASARDQPHKPEPPARGSAARHRSNPPPEPDLGATAEMEPFTELPPPPPQGRASSSAGRRSRQAADNREGEAPAELFGATAGLSESNLPSSAPSPPKPKTDEPPLFPPHRSHPEDLIDMTAMVDIVFFLLIFFLVTSLQALEAVMNMPTPQSGEPGVATGKSVSELENDPNYITVRIEDDDSIWVENTQVFNDQELALKLRTARQESDAAKSLLVIGDADASHGTAVRVFDAAATANLSGISLVVQEKGDGR